MLNRYAIIHCPHASLKEGWNPIYNAHPTKQLPVFQKMDEARLMYWGRMAKWSNNKIMSPKLYNISADNIFEKASTRRLITSQRCLIPMDGFFVWRQLGKKKQSPYYYYGDQKKEKAIAGVWESSGDLDGQDSFCFLCLVSNVEGEERPVVIEGEDFEKWLNTDSEESQIRGLLDKSGTISLASHPVSPAISDERLNVAQLIDPINPTDQHGNYTLF